MDVSVAVLAYLGVSWAASLGLTIYRARSGGLDCGIIRDRARLDVGAARRIPPWALLVLRFIFLGLAVPTLVYSEVEWMLSFSYFGYFLLILTAWTAIPQQIIGDSHWEKLGAMRFVTLLYFELAAVSAPLITAVYWSAEGGSFVDRVKPDPWIQNACIHLVNLVWAFVELRYNAMDMVPGHDCFVLIFLNVWATLYVCADYNFYYFLQCSDSMMAVFLFAFTVLVLVLYHGMIKIRSFVDKRLPAEKTAEEEANYFLCTAELSAKVAI